MAKLSETLRERGYVNQFSAKKLEEITDGKKRVVYLGIDPSADSLHAGNLVGLLVLRRFLEDGHKVIILTGGGTGMIGDPGGKSEERNLLDEETVGENSKAVAAQIRKVFGGGDFIEENNAKWLSKLDLLEFLRDVGKHFTVNAMIKKDMVRERLEKETPLSFTEFSYSLLQGYDFLHLNEEYGCDVQVGGSDQWSNILAGVEFIRRKAEKEVFAFTWPLVVNRSTGKKFGKSEQGAIWLDPEQTSPFEFYQFWLNTEDGSVEEYLLKMTMLSSVEIDAVMELQKRDAKERHAQKLLARALTTLVHGEQAAEDAERISQILFGDGNIVELDESGVAALRAAAPTCPVSEGELIIDVLVKAKLADSKREAKKFLKDNAVTLNGGLAGEDTEIGEEDLKNGIAILKRGKRNVCVLTLA
ncbi:MAG TPA: tyrosine--tRNA ligase [Candidatus Paceibacterota bacterium]|jgi:tyrosyl-tRNA synthetase|nr:tyrosine--tRNA ligase [Candidatus Paceibacterota bacterium]